MLWRAILAFVALPGSDYRSRTPRWLRWKLAVVALIICIAGCSKQELLQRLASPEEQTVAKGYFDLLRQQQYESIEKAMDPGISGPAAHQTLVVMSASIPAGNPISVKLVGAQRFKSADYSTVNLSFEYQFPAEWLLTNVALKKRGNSTTIVGFHVYPRSASLQEQNKFTLRGKAPFQYLILASVIVVPLFIVYALVVCIKTKLRGQKWPWILFIIFGLGKAAVNWTTGQRSFGLISIQLFGASGAAQLYGPWILAVSFPIGAVIFLLRKKKLSAAVSQN
jgi:hypothetical protein